LIFHFLFLVFEYRIFIFCFSFFIFHFSFCILYFLFLFLFFYFCVGKNIQFSIRRIDPQTTQAGRKSSVPACRYSPRSNSAVSRKTISTFPENPPRVSCSDFAPFLLRISSVILQHGENHASETIERFLRFCSVFFCLKI